MCVRTLVRVRVRVCVNLCMHMRVHVCKSVRVRTREHVRARGRESQPHLPIHVAQPLAQALYNRSVAYEIPKGAIMLGFERLALGKDIGARCWRGGC